MAQYWHRYPFNIKPIVMTMNKNNLFPNDNNKQDPKKTNDSKKHDRKVIDTESTPVTEKVRPDIDHGGLKDEGTNVSYEERRGTR
jgi:hypothetical protein